MFTGYLPYLSSNKPKQLWIHTFNIRPASSKYFKASYLILNVITGFLEILNCIIFYNLCLWCKILHKLLVYKRPLFLLFCFFFKRKSTVNSLGDPGSRDSKTNCTFSPLLIVTHDHFCFVFSVERKNQMCKVQSNLLTLMPLWVTCSNLFNTAMRLWWLLSPDRRNHETLPFFKTTWASVVITWGGNIWKCYVSSFLILTQFISTFYALLIVFYQRNVLIMK